jgi:hypothetical protein
MNEVFVVTEGDYEDEGIVAICSTMKKAEYAKRLFNSNNQIQQWKVDVLPEHPLGLFPWRVLMDVNGNVDMDGVRPESIYMYRDEWEPEYCDDPKNVQFRVWAKNEEAAILIANKKRLELIEQKLWTVDWEKWCDMTNVKSV